MTGDNSDDILSDIMGDNQLDNPGAPTASQSSDLNALLPDLGDIEPAPPVVEQVNTTPEPVIEEPEEPQVNYQQPSKNTGSPQRYWDNVLATVDFIDQLSQADSSLGELLYAGLGINTPDGGSNSVYDDATGRNILISLIQKLPSMPSYDRKTYEFLVTLIESLGNNNNTFDEGVKLAVLISKTNPKTLTSAVQLINRFSDESEQVKLAKSFEVNELITSLSNTISSDSFRLDVNYLDQNSLDQISDVIKTWKQLVDNSKK